MAKHSAIEWTDHTWNPWRGCIKVSPGCKHCYMFRDQKRYGRDPQAIVRAASATFNSPLKWADPARVFTCSWSDFFLEEAVAWRDDAWEIIRQTPHLTYQILTKRPENIRGRLPNDWGESYTNVWLGISAENQELADERIPILLEIPARVHFVSAEPLLGPINLSPSFVCRGCGYTSTDKRIQLDHQLCTNPSETVDWVITGGESDLSKPRFCDPNWSRSIRDQCVDAGVAYFHKQNGGTRKIDGAWGGRVLDGRTWDEFPQGSEQ